MNKKGLGRGLDALLSDNSMEFSEKKDVGIVTLRVSDVEPNKNQARKKFDQTALSELASSIAKVGLIQPISVRKKANGFYEIIAGERRWRACKMAGISEIKAIVFDIDDGNAAELSLIENLQREDLNPVEEAQGYKTLMSSFNLTQEEAAERVGKSRAAVANIIRILRLPKSILSFVEDGSLSYGHARALLPIAEMVSEERLKDIASSLISNDVSVRDTEKLIRKIISEANEAEKGESIQKTAVEASYLKHLEKNISTSLGRLTKIKDAGGGKGTITFTYSDTDDFELLIKKLCGDDFFAKS